MSGDSEPEVRHAAAARPEVGLTWRHLWTLATERLGSDIEARRIVERAAGPDVWWKVLDTHVPERAIPFFDDMVERRAAGEPLQYVLQRWGFRTLDLFVDRRVLIPRPETEVVVEVAIRELRRIGSRRPLVADLGTGSGAIALSLAVEVADARVWATDASEAALAVARANLAGIGSPAARVRLVEGSWFDALPEPFRGQFDVLVSNPPYIGADEQLPSEVVDWEPSAALIAGPTGLEAVEELVEGAPEWLTPGGALVVEIAPHQADRVLELVSAAPFQGADIRPDLNGRARVLVARR